MTDDVGLFIDSLNREPGIYTARYADDELASNSNLSKYQLVVKLLRKMNGENNRNVKYRCCVTSMMLNGDYYQEIGESERTIANGIIDELKKLCFYSVLILNGITVAFSDLKSKGIDNTYRYNTIKKFLKMF